MSFDFTVVISEPMRHFLRRFAALLMLCSGVGAGHALDSQPAAPADPLALFTQQKLDWQPCNPSLFDERNPFITELGTRLSCAAMRAPLDYNNPDLGELSVALMRAAAEQPQRRLGTILANPGGPGADGLLLGAKLAYFFVSANPADPTGKLLKDMGNRYDLIGFSPRGVGASTTLTCVSSYLQQIETNATFDRSPQGIQNKQSNERLRAETCAKNPLTQHIHTDATARDMDLIRHLLGEEKLNYIGYSYGSWLGAWYASLFPQRVGRMMIDSSMNVAGTLDDAKLLSAVGKQRVMDEVMFPYAARNNKLFNLGDNAAQIKSRMMALPPVLKNIIMVSIDLTSVGDFEANLLSITAALGLQALRETMPSADQRSMEAAIQTYTFAHGSTNVKAFNMAMQINSVLFKKLEREAVALLPDAATRISVTCNDLATTGDELYWTGVGNDYAAHYPLSGASVDNTCLYWPKPSRTRPPLAAATKAGPLLMLQSRNDGLTPIEGALKTLDALPNASMIVIENEHRHGLFPYKTDCVDGQVAGYFLNGTQPPRISSCAGKPLPGDVAIPISIPIPISNPTTQPSGKAATAPETNTYTDPAKAEEIMQRIHKSIRDGTRRF